MMIRWPIMLKGQPLLRSEGLAVFAAKVNGNELAILCEQVTENLNRTCRHQRNHDEGEVLEESDSA